MFCCAHSAHLMRPVEGDGHNRNHSAIIKANVHCCAEMGRAEKTGVCSGCACRAQNNNLKCTGCKSALCVCTSTDGTQTAQ